MIDLDRAGHWIMLFALAGVICAAVVALGLVTAHLWSDASDKRACRRKGGTVENMKDGEWRCVMPRPTTAEVPPPV